MTNHLLKLLIGIISAAVVAFVLYHYFGDFYTSTRSPASSSCTETLAFRVGNIDERFPLTETELGEMIKGAVAVWSEAAGSNIAVYSKNSGIDVNLVYDKEQKLSDREKQFRDRIEEQEYSISVNGREYNRLNSAYEDLVEEFRKESSDIEKKINTLNEWVKQKNRRGFSESDFKEYKRRERDIDNAKAQLMQQQAVLKIKADELSTKVDLLNKKIEQKNELVDEYNRMFAGQRKFTQGAYEWRTESRTINIFYFVDKNELKLTIAHEIGHALGLHHVSNPQSVMYEMIGDQNFEHINLTLQDMQELRTVCGDQIN